jgi:hypothetical protein
MISLARTIIAIPFTFTFHTRCISITRSSYFKIFSASFFTTFLSPGIATSINTRLLLLLLLLLLLSGGSVSDGAIFGLVNASGSFNPYFLRPQVRGLSINRP